jgi:hypothetical protein
MDRTMSAPAALSPVATTAQDGSFFQAVLDQGRVQDDAVPAETVGERAVHQHDRRFGAGVFSLLACRVHGDLLQCADAGPRAARRDDALLVSSTIAPGAVPSSP